MRKLLFLIPCVIILIYIAYFFYINSYIKYVPVVLENPNIGYVDAPDLKVDINNLKLVLDFHREKSKIIDGELFITRKLALNKEMVHNYTMQSQKPEIVEQLK